eukprot:1000401_1
MGDLRGGDTGMQILTKRGLGEQAVDFAIERNDFEQAFLIAEKTCKGKVRDVNYQWAMSLEDEGHFEKAEDQFIKAGKPKEAVDMYIHQMNWQSALRIAEEHQPNAIVDISAAQAAVAEEQKNFAEAEKLFLRAKKAESAVKMYVRTEQWDEAARVAADHAPQLISEVTQAQMVAMKTNRSGESLEVLIKQATLMRQNRQYSGAIDVYLGINEHHGAAPGVLAKHWGQAVKLALDHEASRADEVVTTVSKRLAALNLHSKGAEFLLAIDRFEDAIDMFMQGNNYDKAEEVANANAPHFLRAIEKHRQKHLDSIGDFESLGSRNPTAAAAHFAQTGEWARVYALVEEMGA